MEGFLNNENKIRRMDSKSDMLAFSEILKPLFSIFITTASGWDSKIDKFLGQYQTTLNSRVQIKASDIAKPDNDLEMEIQSGSFSDAEKVILLYFYETQRLSVDANFLLYQNLMNKQNALEVDINWIFTFGRRWLVIACY